MRKTVLKSASCGAATALAIVALVPGAWAQAPAPKSTPTDPAAIGETQRIDDIVVTARKREETLLNVPLAITAFSAQRIETIGARNLQDLSAFTPGFYLTPLALDRADRSVVSLKVRGMSSETGSALATLFVDGVAVASSQTSGIDDIERVEVIKGPQSALFGRATFSGAVNLITKTPSTTDWGGRAKAEIGTYGLHDVSLSIEGPLVRDVLAVRLTGRDYKTTGQYSNNARPSTGIAGTTFSDRLGAQKTRSLSGVVYFTPGERLKVRARGEVWRDRDGAPASVQIDKSQFNCSFGQQFTYLCGEVSRPPLSRIGYDTALQPVVKSTLLDNPPATFLLPFREAVTNKYGLARNAYQASLSADYDVTDHITFSAIGAFHRSRYSTITGTGRDITLYAPNASAAFIPGAPALQQWDIRVDSRSRDYSYEARLASTGDTRFRWLLGFSKLKELGVGATSYYSPFSFIQFADGLPTYTRGNTTGVFGSAGYDILRNMLTLSLEGRYQWAKPSSQPTLASGALGTRLGATYKKFLPRAILNYKPTPDINAYVSFARGNRPGAFNATILPLTPAQQDEVFRQTGARVVIPEEKLDDYEGGLKTSLLNRKLDLSVAVYHMIWKNQGSRASATLPVIPTAANPNPMPNFFQVQVTNSVGKTVLNGLEFEGTAHLTNAFTMAATFDIADSKILSFNCVYCVTVIGTNNVKGNRVPRTPKYSATLSADYSMPAFDTFNAFAHADFIYQGRKYESELNLAYTGQVKKVNLRAGIQNKAFRIEGYVKNLFQNKALDNINRYSADLLFPPTYAGSTIALSLPERRSFGLRAAYNF